MSAEVGGLTDQEREALWRADESCGCGGVGDEVLAVIERIVAERERAAAEKAWDESCLDHYSEGDMKFDDDGPGCPENPYRADRIEKDRPEGAA